MRRALIGALAVLTLLAPSADAHWSDYPRSVPKKVAHKVVKKIRKAWKMPRHRKAAISVASCESKFDRFARNGQFHGVFQMGYSERERCGKGWRIKLQVWAAKCWWKLTGRTFSNAWACG